MGPEYSNAVNWISYQLNPRASIFRRDSSDVMDVESMKRLMRSNNYTQDKVSALQASAWQLLMLSLICLEEVAHAMWLHLL